MPILGSKPRASLHFPFLCLRNIIHAKEAKRDWFQTGTTKYCTQAKTERYIGTAEV